MRAYLGIFVRGGPWIELKSGSVSPPVFDLESKGKESAGRRDALFLLSLVISVQKRTLDTYLISALAPEKTSG